MASQARLDAIAAGVPNIARKVLDVVPIQESWTDRHIVIEMKRVTGSCPDSHTVRGCLRKLVDAGLVKEHPAGMYRRIMPKDEPDDVAPTPALHLVRDTTPAPTEPAMPTAAVAPPPPSAVVDVASQLAHEASALRAQAAALTAAADKLDELALQHLTEVDTLRARLDSLERLRALLKDL